MNPEDMMPSGRTQPSNITLHDSSWKHGINSTSVMTFKCEFMIQMLGVCSFLFSLFVSSFIKVTGRSKAELGYPLQPHGSLDLGVLCEDEKRTHSVTKTQTVSRYTNFFSIVLLALKGLCKGQVFLDFPYELSTEASLFWEKGYMPRGICVSVRPPCVLDPYTSHHLLGW